MKPNNASTETEKQTMQQLRKYYIIGKKKFMTVDGYQKEA